MATLPSEDKRLTGGGADFTVWFWVEATDASAATQTGARLLRDAARAEGLPTLRIIRSHAASVEGRAPQFPSLESHLGRPDEWGTYYKVEAPAGSAPVGRELLDPLHGALGKPDAYVSFRGDQEKFLMDDGRSIVARFWVGGPTLPDALRTGREDMLAAMRQVGLADWTIVRVQAATAEFRYREVFPGALRRVPQDTEETR